MAEDNLTINVWVGNLGRYNEGTLIGGWLRLPTDEQQIDRFLTEQVGLTLDAQQAYEIGRQGGVVYEEYGIFDHEYTGLLAALDYRPGEYEDLHALNTLAQAARIFTQDQPEALEAVRLAADMNGVHDPIGLANLLVQSEDIEYMTYDPPQGITQENTSDLDEMYGWHCVNQNSELAKLLDSPYGMYFDVAKYGRDAVINDNVTLADHGFLIDATIPDTKRYSSKELKQIIDAYTEPGLDAEREAEQANPDQISTPEPFRLESLLEPGERIMEYTLAGTATNWGAPTYQCIMPDDSTDISAGLEDTFQRIIADRAGHGDATAILAETMGAKPAGELDPANGIILIDQGYALPAPITSFNPKPAKEEEPNASKDRDTVLDGIRQRASQRTDDSATHPPVPDRTKTRTR